MSVELTVLISVLSVSLSLFFGLHNSKRNFRTDAQKDAADMTTVIVKLENIGTGITEIKGEMRSMKEDAQESRERIVKVEESAKQAHRRLDELYRRHGAGRVGE